MYNMSSQKRSSSSATKSKRSCSNSNVSTGSKSKTRKRNYSVRESIADQFNIPNELLREMSSYMNKEEKVYFKSTIWKGFLPKLKFLYSYEDDRDEGKFNEDYEYDLEPGEIDVEIDDEVKNKIQSCIAKYIILSVSKKKNRGKRILPKDIDYVNVYIRLRNAVKRNGERSSQIDYPPYDGDEIVINSTFKNHSYSVYLDSFKIIMTKSAPDPFSDNYIHTKCKEFKIKMYAHK